MAEFASKKLDKFFRSNYHSRKEIITSVKPGEEETADYLTASNMITTFMDTSHSEYLYTIRPSESGGIRICC